MSTKLGSLYADIGGNGAEGVRLTGSTKEHAAKEVIAITPSDTAELNPPIRSILAAGAGNIAIECIDGSQITISGIQNGQVLPVQCRKVLSTGTTATTLRGFR